MKIIQLTGYKLTLIGVVVLASAFWLPPSKVTVYLAGDSTMANKEAKAHPETGWGMPFIAFFDSTVRVDNKAKNGRSTSSFISEGLWKSITDSLQAGDYVLIQFGHNDEVASKSTFTSQPDFEKNLLRMVNETRAKGAIPVLITPVARRKFDASGIVKETHEDYAPIVRAVAASQNVPLIDLDKESIELLQNFGVEDSKMLFNYLSPGQNPNYPQGRTDDTHFSELGARKVAEIVLKDIRSLRLSLADRIVISNLGIK
ncbi:rhamnogalacturonan acetylesterase [Mucilaginibacter terrae]|uniref:Lysophospholipase L1-like esterase n=1 Tax=Mucilaginibacter terrae TaxID=1955052 RepID=A0ABU3GNN0_9SPHI|nr:rhamnogalacturonan acetylesterase [Mucilaginibacter terrae]MDT3401379.1 lysophospholipase L1-like esterase [Mucilaginibacter terrae]